VLGSDIVVLFTDGVIEARRGRELYGTERLLTLVAATEMEVEAVTHAVVTEALAFQDGNPRDDIAVVTLQGEPRHQDPDTLRA
jgi:serine phosphatase RsbU (regulator of sigma subunit)